MSSTPPIPASRLRQIATDAANQAIGSAEFYDHAQTEKWNATIINFILKALIAESSPDDKDAPPQYKFAVNSTIVQHLVPTSQLNKSKGTSATTDAEATGATATDGKPHVGRRGMHSATGAYWDETKDGMWTWKYDGPEGKGMDVIVMLLWISTGNQAS